MVDALAIAGVGRRRAPPIDPAARIHQRFAVFVPAWQESSVIAATLERMRASWGAADFRIYVGVYANDVRTMAAAQAALIADPRIRLVINHAAGPTTKGGCLNRLWSQLCDDRASGAFAADAVLLHDAEDWVDAGELVVLASALSDADYAQIPVVPLLSARRQWIGGHYCDEFAEAHGKEMPVRAAICGAMPTAGVGCAFRVAALDRLAGAHGPFPADSMTEDYELGLRLAAAGARGAFVTAYRPDGGLVASRAFFPHRLPDAVRQKSRWLRGIALDGWDRLGWQAAVSRPLGQRIAGFWMLWRDRRVVLAAAAIVAGYAALLLSIAALVSGTAVPDFGAAVNLLMLLNLVLLCWRLAVRAWMTGRLYGPRQALLAVARQPVSNIVLVMTAWRALLRYWLGLRGTKAVWEKTLHDDPQQAAMVRAR